MEPKNAFGVVLRSVGLGMLLYAVHYLVYAVIATLEIVAVDPTYGRAYWINGFMPLLPAIYFLRGAPLLVKFSYSKDTPSDS